MNFGRVGVLLGGDSSEREISIRSGKAISKALQSQGVKVVEIGEKEPVREGVLAGSIDAAFIALHGKNGEDGAIQQFLEDQRIPYTGSGVAASRLAIDKIKSKETFLKNGLPTPSFAFFLKKGKKKPAAKNFPVVVKPSRQGSSIGITIVRRSEDFEKAVAAAFSFDDEILVEEFVAGRELTVGVLGDEALPVIEIRPDSGVYDFTSKYTVGKTQYLVPAPIEEKTAAAVRAAGLAAHQVLGCRDLSRADILLGSDGKFHVLEVNTIPGFTETSLLPKAAKAAGISFEQLCLKILEMAVCRAKKTNQKIGA